MSDTQQPAAQEASVEVTPKAIPTIDEVRQAFLSVPDINTLVSLSGPCTPQSVQDVTTGPNGEVEGVRIIFALNPTISAVYCGEKTGGQVAVFVFPGDDAMLTSSILLALVSALRHLDTELVIADSFAPVFHDGGGVSFSPEKEQIMQAMYIRYEGALGHLTKALGLNEKEPETPGILVPKQPEIILPG